MIAALVVVGAVQLWEKGFGSDDDDDVVDDDENDDEEEEEGTRMKVLKKMTIMTTPGKS